MGCRSCRCLPCIICEPKSSLEDSGEALQLEISGATNLGSHPSCTSLNGTFALNLRGADLTVFENIFVTRATCIMAVDNDPNYRGEEILSCTDAFPCCIYAGRTGSGGVVAAVVYGTTGGGLSAVLLAPAADYIYSANVVLSASSRRVDCSAVNVSAASITSVNYNPPPFGVPFCGAPTAITLSTV